MRRPPFGKSILRGLTLVWRKMMMNVSHGYVPSNWSKGDRADVDNALRWIGAFIDWYELRSEDDDVQVDSEVDGTGSEEQGQGESQEGGGEGEEPGLDEPLSVGPSHDIFGTLGGDPN